MFNKKMRIVSVITAIAMCFTSIPCSYNMVTVSAKDTKTSKKVNAYIIKCDTDSEYDNIKSIYKQKNIKVVSGKYLHKNNLISVKLSDEEVNAIKKKKGIHVEEDYNVSGFSKSQRMEPKCTLSELKDINSDKAEYSDNPYEFVPCAPVEDEKFKNEVLPWNIECVANNPSQNDYKGKNVKIAVIDSGIDVHNDLNTKGWVDFSKKINGYKPIDSNGHGTEIAGVIGAKENGLGMIGIASDADIYSVKILNKDNTAAVSAVIKAIQWCIDNDMDIINMSFGMDQYSEMLENIIKKAYDNNILMIASAGNDNKLQYPAKYKEVISVGAIDSNLNPVDYSPNDVDVDLLAPGKDVQTSGFVGSYVITEGTSIAAAHVTGVAAAIKSIDTSMDAIDLQNILLSSAIQTKNSYSGIVNYSNAISLYNSTKNECKPVKTSTGETQITYNDIKNVGENNSIVKGSWSKDRWGQKAGASGHYTIINEMDLSYFSAGATTYTEKVHNRWIVADSAYRTDSIDALREKRDGYYAPYHANTHYSLNELTGVYLPFLYELARRRLVLGRQLQLSSSNYNGNVYHGVSIPLAAKRRIIDDIYALYANLVSHYGNQIDMGTVNHRGYMVLGVYLHMTQDLYCHRANFELTNITTKWDGTEAYSNDSFGATREDNHIAYNNMTGNNGRNYWDLFTYIKRYGSMPIIRVKEKLNENFIVKIDGTEYPVSAAAAYEDNPYFYSNRFEASSCASKWMIEYMRDDIGDTSKGFIYYVFDNWGLKLTEWNGPGTKEWKANPYY